MALNPNSDNNPSGPPCRSDMDKVKLQIRFWTSSVNGGLALICAASKLLPLYAKPWALVWGYYLLPASRVAARRYVFPCVYEITGENGKAKALESLNEKIDSRYRGS